MAPPQGLDYANVQFQAQQETTPVKGLLTIEGIRFTFIAMMGAGLAEEVGLMNALIRKLVGTDRAALDLSAYPGVTLAGVHAGGGGRPSGERFLVDDVLVVQGDTGSIRRLADTAILAPSTDGAATPFEGTTTLMSGEVGVAELVVRPRSAAIGMPVFPGMVTSSGDLVILAIQRQGEDLRPEAGGLAACALVLLRVRTMTQAYRAINWTVVVLVGGMIPLSHALQDTGAADQIVQALGHVVGEAGPYPLLIGLLLVCAILGQSISNTATALLTPVATPGNLMVMGPGGYKFGDYWKLGLPVLIWYMLVAVLWVPLIWRF